MTKRTNTTTESQPSRWDVAHFVAVAERVERVFSELALVGILAICFAFSFTHTASLFRAALSIDGVWPNMLATCVELAFFAFGAEYRRRAALAVRFGLKFFEAGLGLPLFATFAGLALVGWANLAEARLDSAESVLAALVAPGFATLVMALFETRRRRTRKAGRSPVKSRPEASTSKPAAQTAPAQPVEPSPAREALTPLAGEQGGELSKTELAARDALAWFGKEQSWPTPAELIRMGHSEGSANRGLKKAKGQQQHPHIYAVGE